MPSTPYMKLYVGDYLGDTQHLSCLEHGAYILLIMAYWQNGGPLKNDVSIIRRITKTSLKEYKNMYENVLNMFDLRDGMLVHNRIEKEIAKREQVSTKARDSANTRWCERNADAMPTQSERNATPIVHSPESIDNTNNNTVPQASRFVRPTLEELTAYCKERGNKVSPQTWLDHYESNGWKVGKNPMKDWKAAVRTWERNDFGGSTSKPLAVHGRSTMLDLEE